MLDDDNTGFILLNRKMLKWEWYDHLPTKCLFLHCLLRANHAPTKWRGHDLKRGDFLTSVSTLVNETGLTTKQVRIALENLEKTNEVARSTSSKNTIISVVKYDEYQSRGKPQGKQGANKGQSGGKVGATDKEYNNDKEHNISNSALENEIVAKYTNIFLQTLNGHVGLIQNLSQDAKNTLVDIHYGLMKSDFDAWGVVCKRILDDEFYLGKGKRKWIITLEWLANEKNVVKIMNLPEKKNKNASNKTQEEIFSEEAAQVAIWEKEKLERDERIRNASK